MKSYLNKSLVYAILAMIGGVFYREFTKFNHFTDKTMLSVVHTHYFLLGMVFFLILLLLEKSFSFTSTKTKGTLVLYQLGLNLTAIMMLVRGVNTGNRCTPYHCHACGYLRNCRHRPYPSGCRHCAAFAANQSKDF